MTLNPAFKPVYGRPRRALVAVLLGASLLGLAPAACAQNNDANITDAREAFRKKDRALLTTTRAVAVAEKHPLAMWPDYWELTNRIGEVQQAEVNEFAARWPGTYVEDRFRNDWLLELGKRRDWVNFAAEFPRFRMNDDREVTCYALLVDHLGGKNVRDAALATWLAQRDADDGCALLAATLLDAKQFTTADIWRKARFAIDAGRLRAARQAAVLISVAAGSAVTELTENPARYMTRSASAVSRTNAELTLLALMRMASNDPEAASGLLSARWERALPDDLAAWAWATVAKQSAMKLQPEAADHYQRAALSAAKAGRDLDWPDDTLAWKVRAALRADNGKARWQQVMQAINAMGTAEQRDTTWVYWKARAMLALAGDSQDTESMRGMGRELLSGISNQLNFYAAMAAEYLGQTAFMPPRPEPPTAEERAATLQKPGLVRGLQLINLGLRSEGEREWNFTLRGMNDRELLAAAQLACDREVYKSCINTSDRTRGEIDMAQRFPTPYLKEVTAHAREIGVDPSYVYGLIRQESRFIMDARSGVGASGLMQLMPATARWTAKKIGLPYTPDLITDRDTNIKLGTSYLKLVLDDFDGSQALAAAAYNAGPRRSRRWREGPALETAVWAENIPFPETRDYVKKVLSNGSYYAALMSGEAPSLKARLGRGVAPAGTTTTAENKDLP
ncbi:MAG: transglycosylase SLT domain-containing protein [Burkholderiales bacterium]